MMTQEEIEIYEDLKNRPIGAIRISESGFRVYVNLRDGVRSITHNRNLHELKKIELARLIDAHL
ncbi:hypothetical protein SEA_TIEDYE_34 [Streptomyces phage TieDye]|uniref:Uncharacterized protein n=3 Tax=Rimavirus rima TaxID=2560784 RepID=A0A8F3E5G5_9CAUD|nr:hypothetical protein SEA_CHERRYBLOSSOM_35 [Streptomyces phage CherryBlossom]QNN99510.1 hypothetical protein SEA_TIEDYE_34 [Streptomyces phage TieDye]QWY81434.1 hypothetical protein PET_TAIDAONE_35 [Streptomyces phage TaidaOne]